MKVFFTLLISFFSLAGNAHSTDVSPAVLESFKCRFSDATSVNWTASNKVFKAQFVLDGQYISAFYNADGQMIALSRNITISQLPVMLQADLRKQLKDRWISELYEYATKEGTTYYATMENADMKITLRSAANGEWMTNQQIEKI